MKAPSRDSTPNLNEQRRVVKRSLIVSRASYVVPVLGVAMFLGAWGHELSGVVAAVLMAAFVAIVMIAVTHAEEIAHRVGEPFGTLVLAVAVTVIEVALIVTLMVTEGEKSSTLARDTVFAAVMIVCNGVVGLSLLINARRHHTVRFSEQGANALLGTLLTLATLTLVFPTFTETSKGPTFSSAQLAFAAVASLVVYGTFVFVQTFRHRWMFLAPDAIEESASTHPPAGLSSGHENATSGSLLARIAGLVISLVAVIGLAKSLSHSIEDAVVWAGAPQSFVGVVIALMVLLPESVAACRAAARNEMQTSLNLSLGSSLASIGLTIPTIAVASIWIDGPIALGLGGKEIVLLVITAAISMLTFGSGRATILQATHHLAVFAAFIFFAVKP